MAANGLIGINSNAPRFLMPSILVSKDLHEQMEALAMIGGTDRMSTLLLINQQF